MEITRNPSRGDGPCSGKADYLTVTLTGSEILFKRLGPILSGGFGVDVVSGCTVRGLLTDELAIDPDYVEGRLQTVFLNGKPVDDIDAARVVDGDVLALSAAMPGLVGATMRRGGRYAVLRQDISHTAEPDCPLSPKPICLTLKLFNLIAADLSPGLLDRGVWMDGDRLADYVRLMEGGVRASLIEIRVDTKVISFNALTTLIIGKRVLLSVIQP